MYLSFTQVAAFNSCRYKWARGYFDRIVPRVDRPKLDLGVATHAGIAGGLVAKHEGATASEVELEVWAAVALWGEEKREKLEKLGMSDEEVLALDELCYTAKGLALKALAEFERAGFVSYVDPKSGLPLVENKLVVPLAGWEGFKGYVDWVAVDKASGYIWLVDFKVRESFQTELAEEFNIQMAIYQRLLRDMYGLDTAGSIAWQIKSTLPKEPQLNKPKKDGSQQMSRSLITTDWPTYKAALERANLDPAEYEEEMKPKLEAVPWFRPAKAYRSRKEIDAVWEQIVVPTSTGILQQRDEMQQSKVSYVPGLRNMGFLNCNGCSYRDLCLEDLRGGDVEFLRKMRFVSLDEKTEEPKEPEPWTPPELIE